MDAKLLMVVIATVIAVAAAAPQYGNYWQQQYQRPSYTCPSPVSTERHTTVFNTERTTIVCSKPGGAYCIQIKPKLRICNRNELRDCLHLRFYGYYNVPIYVGICNAARGHCAGNGNVLVCDQIQAVNNEVAIQKALESELDCFCVADEKGHKVCTPENCDSGDHAAKSDEEDDCFCVADEKGHKVCSPENCDSRVRAAAVDKQATDCFCLKDANGEKRCSPENCDSGDHAAKSDEEDDCFCVADEKGHKVCSPENCDSRVRATAVDKQATDCFCLKDANGEKRCRPENCDVGKQ